MSEYTQGVCHDGAAILKDGQPLTIEQILEALRMRDEYRDHLAVIAEMTGNNSDIGAAHEGVNALVEDLARHKRMFAAACESLGEIQRALGNSIVGIEPTLVKELIEERDALAAHVEILTAKGDWLASACDHCTCDDVGVQLDHWLAAKAKTPTTSLARRDELKQAEIVEQWADCLESVIRHVESEHAKDPNYPAIGAEGMGEFAADMRTEAEKLRKKTEGHQ